MLSHGRAESSFRRIITITKLCQYFFKTLHIFVVCRAGKDMMRPFLGGKLFLLTKNRTVDTTCLLSGGFGGSVEMLL